MLQIAQLNDLPLRLLKPANSNIQQFWLSFQFYLSIRIPYRYILRHPAYRIGRSMIPRLRAGRECRLAPYEANLSIHTNRLQISIHPAAGLFFVDREDVKSQLDC